MSAISLKSISGITSITTPAGVDNQFTLHNNNTTEAVKLDTAGNFHFHNHVSTTGISTAANFKTGVSNLHSLGLTLSGGQLDVGNHIKLGHAGIVTATTFVGNVTGNVNNTTLLLQTGGTERARIDSSGRLLVGTTSNSNAVRAVFQGYHGGGDNFQARVQFQTNQATNLSTNQHLANLLFTNSSGSVGAEIRAIADNAWGTNDYPGRLEFYTTPDGSNTSTERLRIDSSGRVHIGSSNNTGSNTKFVIGFGNNLNTTALINTEDVDTNALTLSNWDGATTTNKVMIAFDNSGNGGFDIGMPAGSGDFAFQASGGERLRITSAGNVGVNVTDPDQKLEVDGIIKGSSYFQAGASGTASNNWHFGAEGNGEFRFYTGNYGAGDLKQKISSNGDVLPGANNTSDLGSGSLRWRNVYTTDLQLSNEGKTNDVDGTWGNYTIQEGESDLFLINNRNGKKYVFLLKEVS